MIISPLAEIYRSSALGMGEYHGFEMPSLFTSLEHEFDAAMRRSALVDLSFMGRIEVRGVDRADFLHRLSTNDFLNARPNAVVSTVFTTEKGRIIDHATAALRKSEILLIVSPGNEGALLRWLEKFHITEDVLFREITHETSMISIVGPEVRHTLSACFGVDLQINTAVDFEVDKGTVQAICAETSRLPVIHLISSPPVIAAVRQNLLDMESAPVVPMGYQAFEAYRIARGVAAIGAELSDSFNPYEAGLRESISFAKGCYIGQEVIARLDTYQKVRRRLVGLVFVDQPIGRGEALPLLLKGGQEVGVVTSWLGESLYGKYIGLGIVSADGVHEGDPMVARFPGNEVRSITLSIPILVQGASVA